MVVTVTGEVDGATVHAMRSGIEEATARIARDRFVLDVRRVTYLDSLGITVLAQCFDQVRALGSHVTVACGDRTAALLESLGLDAEVAIVGDRAQALALVDPPDEQPPAPEAAHVAVLRRARELIESGTIPADDPELARLRFTLEDAPPPGA
ncbi:MAG: hypothetical protein QOH13_1885 [Thermoleophilaceae bacterium]|nr:hypothetical protein [Thermoleophilaceae bacterium]